VTPAPSSSARKARSTSTTDRFDWRRIAYHVLVSRALDDVEELTNKHKTTTAREDLVLYQFSARGHDVAQIILGSLLDHKHDAVGAYYRNRPLLLSLGLEIDDALGSPLGRAGGFSDGRDIGVVCNMPNRGGPVVLPMSGDVGSQYTPCAGWAQSIRYHETVLGDRSWTGAMGIVLGGEASVATNGFWSALTMATTLELPMLFYIEDNGLGISVRGDMQTPGGNIARNLGSFRNLFVRDGDGCDPAQSAKLFTECVDHVRGGGGPALIRLTVPRLSSHSGPDNQLGYRTEDELETDASRDPLLKLKAHIVPAMMTEAEWTELEAEVKRDVEKGLAAARARPAPDPANVKKYVYAEESPVVAPVVAVTPSTSLGVNSARGSAARKAHVNEAYGGLSRRERGALPGSDVPANEGPLIRFAEAVRRTLARELEVNPKALIFGEDVGRKGGVHLVTEGLQKRFGESRVFDTSLSEEGIIGRAMGMAISGLMPVAEIQFRKYADPATEQLNNCGTLRWRTANRFAAPIVVRMPGGFGKDVGDPWHSLSDEVRFAHMYGWQIALPSNAADAVGLLRAAMRSPNPSVFFEHRSLLMTSDGSSRYPGDDYVLPFGKAATLIKGSDLTLVSWGALVHRCREVAAKFDGNVELLDLRTIAPWDRDAVLTSVKKTGRCVIVHEDNLTAGFGAEIAATIAQEAFWMLDAPIERVAVDDVPMPYHPLLLEAVLPSVERIEEAVTRVLGA
jgi:2-oxoisovalerate dehydrogenase E1 component